MNKLNLKIWMFAGVNALTDELKEATGTVIDINSKGEKVEKDFAEHNVEVAAARKKKNSTWLGKAAAKLGGLGVTAEKASEHISATI